MSFTPRRVNKSFLSIKNGDTRTIVFIDSSLPNCETLAQRVVTTARVIIIGSEDDGVQEITDVLCASNCSQVYIFTSGTPGCMYLGNSELSLNTLSTYSLELENWFAPTARHDLVNSANLYLSGCNIAAGDVGEEFITKLNSITGAKIAATVNTIESNILVNK